MSPPDKRPEFTPEEQAAAESKHRKAMLAYVQRAGRDDAAVLEDPNPNRFYAAEWQAEYEAAFRAAKESLS